MGIIISVIAAARLISLPLFFNLEVVDLIIDKMEIPILRASA